MDKLWIFPAINIVALVAVDLILLYALRALISKVSLSKLQKQLLFVAISAVALTPIGYPAGVGVVVFIPNLVLLAYLAAPEVLEWYVATASFVVPAFFVTLAISWWIGSNRFLLDAENVRTEKGKI